ncbi:MAG: hypothetical protein ABH864_04230 [archaeon]
MRRGYVYLLFFALAALVLIAKGAIAGDFGDCSPDQELFSISTNFNAHGEAHDQNQYDIRLCFDDFFKDYYRPPVGVGAHDCVDYVTYDNSFIRLSGQTDAHAESPALSTPGYVDNICYGNLQCFLAGVGEDCNESMPLGSAQYSLIVSLSGVTDAHLGLANYYDYALCCRAENYEPICDYDGLCEPPETPMNCPDCESECGDGLVEGFEECDPGPPLNLTDHDCTNYDSDSPYVGGTLDCYPRGHPNECTYNITSCDPSECSDGEDNDLDEATDYPADFSCSGPEDNDESEPKAACQDGDDNDLDGNCDFDGAVGMLGCSGLPDSGCTSFQDDDETNCGDGLVETGEQCDCGTPGLACNWTEVAPSGVDSTCEDIDSDYWGGTLGCDASCSYVFDDCEGYPGFCEAEQPFYFEDDSGALLSPSSCDDYNRVYEGLDSFNNTRRKELCVNDCVPGASDPANNGYGGGALVDWGCAYDEGTSGSYDGECYFYFNSTTNPNSQCRVDYDILSDCGPDNPFRRVNVTSSTIPPGMGWDCTACSGGESSCETEIMCPRVIQLPLIGAFGIALAVIVITLVYVYLKRKK